MGSGQCPDVPDLVDARRRSIANSFFADSPAPRRSVAVGNFPRVSAVLSANRVDWAAVATNITDRKLMDVFTRSRKRPLFVCFFNFWQEQRGLMSKRN